MAEDRLRARIATLAAAEPALAEGLALRGAMLEILDHAPVSLPELRLPADLIRARLAAGVPLLDGLELPATAEGSSLFQRLTVAMLADPDARQPAETILRALERHRLHAEQLIGEAVVGHQAHLVALADGAEVSSALVETLADLAARPLLAQVARRLQPALALSAWTRSYCPICGARPIRAEGAQQAAGAASLRCGRCTTSWAWTLPGCPSCQQSQLSPHGTWEIAGAGRWTLLGCERCLVYLKSVDSPHSEELAALLVDDLASWPLDRAALEAGLGRADGPGRRLEHGDPAGEDLDDD